MFGANATAVPAQNLAPLGNIVSQDFRLFIVRDFPGLTKRAFALENR